MYFVHFLLQNLPILIPFLQILGNQKRDPPQKRQLGRYPRIPFTSHQISILEERFQQNPYLSSEQATILSQKLQLADVKVKIWFQNRRARKRREEMGQIKKEKKKIDMSESVNNVMSHPQDFVASSHLVPYLYITPGCSVLDVNK
ncbi:unnamed protein product [Acanthoscelides obtectus]|uniref:Homeobox domain-containing protein n=1 Tax=Acanthoscelides obtectus TaxID=200917 RepID=A0A9P0PY73_ACAOB|nr:unnamed protein product [Acanthoscelides obtectus]CAK1664889.1 T-cell leukemia homeobox protein 1 [Acanthoscelides obtectus]